MAVRVWLLPLTVRQVVDSSDKERLSLTRKELLSMLEEEELKNTILLVFANKMDMKGAATEVEVSQALGLHAIKERSETQPSRTQCCAALVISSPAVVCNAGLNRAVCSPLLSVFIGYCVRRVAVNGTSARLRLCTVRV